MGLHELREKGYFFDGEWIRTFGRALPSLVAIALRHPLLVVHANRACPDGPENLRPDELPYEIPSYSAAMECGATGEQYLRSTYLCDPCTESIVAMAHELGAFETDDWDFGERAFQFVNRNIRVDFSPIKSATETLHTGHGTCIDKMSLFIGLCRAAGIPARYRLYSPTGVQALYDIYFSADPLVQRWFDALGFFILHGSAEVYIDGEWVISDVSADFYHAPSARIPVPHFGEDPADTWIKPARGVMQKEGLPLGLKLIGSLPFILFGGTGRAINASVKANLEEGQRRLEDTTLEEYDRKIRETYTPKWIESAQKATRVLDEL